MIEKNLKNEKDNNRGRLILGGIALVGTGMIGFGVAELAINGIAAAETVLGFSSILLGATALAANAVNNSIIKK